MVLRLSHSIFNVFLIFLQETTNSSIYYTLIPNSSSRVRASDFDAFQISRLGMPKMKSMCTLQFQSLMWGRPGYYICNSIAPELLQLLWLVARMSASSLPLRKSHSWSFTLKGWPLPNRGKWCPVQGIWAASLPRQNLQISSQNPKSYKIWNTWFKPFR